MSPSPSDAPWWWRRAIVVLLAAAVLLPTAAANAGDRRFADVGDEHPFVEQIEAVAATGIADGFADGTYRPAAPVSRQAMAAFLTRTGSHVTQREGNDIGGPLASSSPQTVKSTTIRVPGGSSTRQQVVVEAEVVIDDVNTTGCSPCVVALSVVDLDRGETSGERLLRLEPDAGGEVRGTITASDVFSVPGGLRAFRSSARIVSASGATPSLTIARASLRVTTAPFPAPTL
jgi:hypothetical protein